jgi:hypothetical protein
MATATQHRLIGWPGSPVYSRQLAAPRQWRGGHWIALTLIILLGAALRFMLLDHPAIWGDEAATFGRTSGTFAQLCDILRDDGFAPLHYELYWWLHNHFVMTPFMLRLVPAIAGTLTVPAMYFLGRMLSNRRVALWAALFTACSAWMLNYSRDAKMYSEFWLFCTLNYACLIWWFRSKSGIAWWCFVASGIAMVGVDALGFIVIGVGIVWYLTQQKVHWLSSLAYLLALAIIGLGPAGYYHYFNDWHRGQLNWIDFNNDRTGPQLLLELASSLLFKYQFRSETIRYAGSDIAIAPKIGAIAVALVAAIVLIGALPWRRLRRGAIATNTMEEVGAVAWWRALFWILVATVLPVYGWYCASTVDFASPRDWWVMVSQHMNGLWPSLILVAVFVAAICMAARELAATLAMLLLIILAIFLGGALSRGGWSDPETILNTLGNLLAQPWFIIAGGGVGAGLLWNYCAPAGFIRTRSVAAFLTIAISVDVVLAAVIALSLLLFHAAINHQSFSPTNLLNSWQSLLLCPAILFVAAILPVCVAAYRGSVDLRWRLRRWATFLAVVGGILVLCQGIVLALGHPVQSLWVPRYLGFVWPPMAIGIVMLIARLPTRGLRVAGLVCVIGLNLFSFGLRVLADNEPPVNLMMDDIAAGRQHPDRLHTIIETSEANYGPGGGAMDNEVGQYYLELDRMQRGVALVPPEAFHDEIAMELYDFDVDASAGRIHGLLAQQPRLHELIVWTGEDMGLAPVQGDEIAQALGPGWKLVHDQRWTARDHWTWRELFITRRRVYQRQ